MGNDNNIDSNKSTPLEYSNLLKGGIKRDKIDAKYYALFDSVDDGNGILDANEAKSLAEIIANQKAKGFADKDVEMYFNGFVKNVQTQNDSIVASKVEIDPEGGKTITTFYKDDTLERISYYPDGQIKFKEVVKKTQKNMQPN